MPLPKMPTKPAALLSPKDYPKAENKTPIKANQAATKPAVTKAPSSSTRAPATTQKAIPSVAPVSRPVAAPSPAPASAPSKARLEASKATPKALSPASAKAHVNPVKSVASRAADKSGITKLFVLDTNVLMHDPSSLFRFEEHDVYLPMITLEELDDHKKGMTEVARNARQISRSLDALVGDIDHVR